jgi:hypothetical protein
MYQTNRRVIYYDAHDGVKAYYVNAKDRTYTRTSVNMYHKKAEIAVI